MNNAIEADHGRLKSRLRPMRGLKQLRYARVISAGHAFILWGSNIGFWAWPAGLRVLVFDYAAIWYSLVSPSRIGLRRIW